MPLIDYRPKTFSADHQTIIDAANKLLKYYASQGWNPTLRQIYYQFVSKNLFPDNRRWSWTGRKWVKDDNGTKNAPPNYKWLCGIINDARQAGLIDWEALVDITRELKQQPKWDSPTDILESCAAQFRFDKWAKQDYRPEVWIEKDALLSVINDVCNALQVPYFSCRGYTSMSAMWQTGQRLLEHNENEQVPVIIHLGDHDPSGWDMSRDNEDRLKEFMRHHNKHFKLDFKRIALNMTQIQHYNPPSDPAKLTDSRSSKYIEEFGDESWELDALDPQVMIDLIDLHVLTLRNDELWEEELDREARARSTLEFAARNWSGIEEWCDKEHQDDGMDYEPEDDDGED